jgi:hypothetical protein
MLSSRLNKKGLSIMIGYVLLITAAVVIGVVVYQWMKTYVPTEVPDCPDGISIFIEDAYCGGGNLSVTIKNSGRFSLGGYFIRTKNDSIQEIATIDLSNLTKEGEDNGGMVLFERSVNALSPGKEHHNNFTLLNQEIHSIELIPIRYQERDNRMIMVICGKSKAIDEVVCT